MDWRQGYIAVDWGTTNRRAYAVSASGALDDMMADGMGLMSVPPGGFDAAAAEIRARLGDRPMLLGGMIGSNRGWREVPYVPAPAGAAELAAAILWIEPGRTGIVPGICQRDPADVMRGEEIQLLGAVATGDAPSHGLVCHPGTHAKWVEMERGRIGRFGTMMTGELFSLLGRHSILSDQLAGEADAADAAFVAAARAALDGADILSGLFGIRARYLLEGEGEGASAASGLLIGNDVRAALARFPSGGPITLIGRPDLNALYAAVLSEAGRETIEIDGEAAFLAGARVLTEML